MNAEMPDSHTVRSAIELAVRAPSVHNTQPWRWLIGARSVHLMADWTRQVPVTDPDGRDLLLSCGAVLHHLRVAFAALGWATTVHRLPNPADPEHLAAIEFHPRAPSDDDVATASAIVRRRTDRRRFSSWPVPTEHLDRLVAVAGVEGALVVPVLDTMDRGRLVTAIAEAAAQQERLPEYASELAAWSGHNRATDEGVLSASALPGFQEHDGTRMRAFATGTLAPSSSGEGEPDGGELVVIATSSDDTVARVRAGEAVSAALLAATDLGLATCPLSQPLEVKATRALIRDRILGGTAEPQLVLRVGWAPVSAGPLPLSPRRIPEHIATYLPGVAPHPHRS